MKVNATMRDGVLEVTMPAPPQPEEEGGRQVEVQEAPKGARAELAGAFWRLSG